MNEQEIQKIRVRIKRCARALGGSLEKREGVQLTQEDCKALAYTFEKEPDGYISKDRVEVAWLLLTDGTALGVGTVCDFTGKTIKAIDVPNQGRNGATVYYANKIEDESKFTCYVHEQVIQRVIAAEHQ